MYVLYCLVHRHMWVGGGVLLILSRVSARCNFHKSLNWARLVHDFLSVHRSKEPCSVGQELRLPGKMSTCYTFGFYLWTRLNCSSSCFSSIIPNQMFAISWHAVSAASIPTKLSLLRTFLNEKMYFMYCRLSRKIKTALLRTIVHSKSFFRPSMG